MKKHYLHCNKEFLNSCQGETNIGKLGEYVKKIHRHHKQTLHYKNDNRQQMQCT